MASHYSASTSRGYSKVYRESQRPLNRLPIPEDRLAPPDDFEISDNSSTSLTQSSSRQSIHKASSFASINIFKDGEIFLQKSVRQCQGTLLEGPRRIMRLCLFGLILPVFLISVPLYVRLILYPPFYYAMAPTDQRSLDQTSSSIWCQGQTVHMNGSFNAFLLPEAPHKKEHFSTHSMLQHITLEDDMKEYWGFFLQKGSIISINACNRYDGGMLMIMRGLHNLRKCAWIGEEDSAEQDEDHQELSNESGQHELSHEFPLMPGELMVEVESEKSIATRSGLISKEILNFTSEERKEELSFYLQKVIKLSKTRKEILKELKKHRAKSKPRRKMIISDETEEKSSGKTIADRKSQKRKKSVNTLLQENSSRNEKLERMKRDLEINSENDFEGEVLDQTLSIQKNVYMKSSYEVSNATREHFMNLFKLPQGLTYERGKINQTTPHDTSNEEHRSSFSSSEEALTRCEGLIGLMPLYPSRKCQSFEDSHTNKVKYKIPITGTYYFVFSSDNEVFNSDLFFNLTLQRVVFDTEAAKETCLNQNDCNLAISFWSHDQAIVEVPEGDWNAAYTMEVKCQPRVAVYLAFLFLIPIFILFCAFH